MTSPENDSIPQDHPIREIWELNKFDPDGLTETDKLIALAKSGDTDAARVLMARYVDLKRREKAAAERGVTYTDQKRIRYHAKLEDYVIEAISLSLRTGDANKGFNLSNKKSRPKQTYLDKQAQCDLAYKVSKYVNELSSCNKAFEVAELELGVSKSSARAAYEKYMKLKIAKK